MDPLDTQTLEDSNCALQELRKTLDSTTACSTLLRTGVAHEAIVAAAKEFGVDLIIISTHGRTGLERVLLGSTVDKLTRYAPCPMLIVRQCEREFVAHLRPHDK